MSLAPPPVRRTLMMSQLGSAAVSDSEEDGVSSLEGLAGGRLDSAPPALQLRTRLQDVPASGRRLHTRSANHGPAVGPRLSQSQLSPA